MKYTRLRTIFVSFATIAIMVTILLPDTAPLQFYIKIGTMLIIIILVMVLFMLEDASLVGREALGDTSETSGELEEVDYNTSIAYTAKRINAVKWWHSLPYMGSTKIPNRVHLTRKYYKNRVIESLTGFEIEHIYNNES